MSRAAAGLPPYLTFPAQVHVNADTLVAEDYGEAEFPLPGSDVPGVQRGRHWSAEMTVSGFPEGTASKAIWAAIKPSLLQGGLTVLAEFDTNPFMATLRCQKNGTNAWVVLNIFNADDVRMQVVEIAASLLPSRTMQTRLCSSAIRVPSGKSVGLPTVNRCGAP